MPAPPPDVTSHQRILHANVTLRSFTIASAAHTPKIVRSGIWDDRMTVFDILFKYREGLFAGLIVTLQLASLVWIIGLVAGSLLAIAAVKWPRLVG